MADPTFSNVQLLLHCDGTNGSTTFTDSSLSNKTVTAHGNAQISTAQSKFGGSSAASDGTGDYLSAPVSFNINTDNYTFEMWVYLNANSNAGFVCDADNFYFELLNGLLYVGDGTTNIVGGISSHGITTGAWHHIALARDASAHTYKCFTDGTQVANSSGNLTSRAITNIEIGDRSGRNISINGYIDEVRITVGECLYSGNFTAPTSPFPDNNPTLSSAAAATATATGGLTVGFIGQPTRGALTITGHTPGFINAALNASAASTATATGGLTVGFIGQPTRGSKTITGHTPAFVNRVLQAISDNWLNTHYRCYLTGSADAVADVELPIKSFQVRQNSSYTYLSVVVPGVDAYQSAITARPNGSIKVQRIYNYADGSSQTFDVISAAFSSLRIDSGGVSGMTGTLTGTGTPPVATTQTVDLYDPTYYSSTNGIDRRYRCRLDPRLRPGDTANINGESFVVAEITQYVNASTTVMEIAE